jgi:hypothetical protein
MRDNLSDTQIRANLRGVLTESGIDANKTAFTCAGGIVRMLGKLLGIGDREVGSNQVADLEQVIRRSRGVQRVHFNLDNWEREPAGTWKLIKGDPADLQNKFHRQPVDPED